MSFTDALIKETERMLREVPKCNAKESIRNQLRETLEMRLRNLLFLKEVKNQRLKELEIRRLKEDKYQPPAKRHRASIEYSWEGWEDCSDT